MTPRIISSAMDDWTLDDRQLLEDLRDAVYPPAESDDWPGLVLDWARPSFGIGLEKEGVLVSPV